MSYIRERKLGIHQSIGWHWTIGSLDSLIPIKNI